MNSDLKITTAHIQSIPKGDSKKKMKISFILAIFLCGSATGAITQRSIKLAQSVHGANLIERFMRRTLMQDESTLCDIILSGARTLSEVNKILAKHDPYFVKLSQNELDTLIDQWLFQMLV